MPLSPDKLAIFNNLNLYLSFLTLVGFIFIVIWAVKLILLKGGLLERYRGWFERFSNHVLPMGFFLMLFSTLMSLYYSDYLGVFPCGLCWLARVFIYSQVFLFGLAWYKNDKRILDYTLLLSGFGIIIASYHQYLQMGYSELIPCPAIASTIDCAKPTFMEYGFVTFPLMAFVTFGVSILLAITYKISRR